MLTTLSKSLMAGASASTLLAGLNRGFMTAKLPQSGTFSSSFAVSSFPRFHSDGFVTTTLTDEDFAPVFDDIRERLAASRVNLFMKGTAQAPKCGYSKMAAQLLSYYGVPFDSHDVIENPALWEGIKRFAKWPTIPQLYVDGELLGGTDVIAQMHSAGELRDLFVEKGLMPEDNPFGKTSTDQKEESV